MKGSFKGFFSDQTEILIGVLLRSKKKQDLAAKQTTAMYVEMAAYPTLCKYNIFLSSGSELI